VEVGDLIAVDDAGALARRCGRAAGNPAAAFCAVARPAAARRLALQRAGRFGVMLRCSVRGEERLECLRYDRRSGVPYRLGADLRA
jgi:hypothetical protein